MFRVSDAIISCSFFGNGTCEGIGWHCVVMVRAGAVGDRAFEAAVATDIVAASPRHRCAYVRLYCSSVGFRTDK
jgi:hypothetical protein